MKNLYKAILVVCLGALASMAAQAQNGNTPVGDDALMVNGGSDNTAIGNQALMEDNTGSYNTAAGMLALGWNQQGSYNTADGYLSLYENLSGSNNTATGAFALLQNTGHDNTASGANALFYNTSGSYNTAVGYGALYSYPAGSGGGTGDGNTALGMFTLYNNTGGVNTAAGYRALFTNNSGTQNTAYGPWALGSNGDGNSNIGIGYAAGYSNPEDASNNIDIGSWGSGNDWGVTRIGSNQTSFYAAGISGAQVSGVPVYVNSSGQLGIVNSSIRFKQDVHDMGDASSRIFLLRPVTYRYKQPYADGSRPIDYGLIAEEVAQVYPDLVVRNADGEIQTVQYQKLTPMLLNEVQKLHSVVQQQAEAIRQLKEQEEQTVAQQAEEIRQLKAQQAETTLLLEKRLAALEAAQPSAQRLESRLETR